MDKVRVVDISRKGVFSLGEARRVLPVIRGITEKYSQTIDAKIARLEALDSSQAELISSIEAEVNAGIKEWHCKIRKLGGEPKGLWLVDFDCGTGYFCWKFPEPDIKFWHSYTDGFSNRIPLSEMPDIIKKEEGGAYTESETVVSSNSLELR